MRWDRLFEDLEGQLASEWEAERAALDTEAERLRLSKVTMRERLLALPRDGALGFELRDGTTLRGRLGSVGADFVAVHPDSEVTGVGVLLLVPLPAITGIVLDLAEALRSARGPSDPRPALADRVTLGFVLRDAARRRCGVRIALATGEIRTGTIDRVGADHLDLALHDAGAPRRAVDVRGYRIISFSGLLWVRMDDAGDRSSP